MFGNQFWLKHKLTYRNVWVVKRFLNGLCLNTWVSHLTSGGRPSLSSSVRDLGEIISKVPSSSEICDSHFVLFCFFNSICSRDNWTVLYRILCSVVEIQWFLESYFCLCHFQICYLGQDVLWLWALASLPLSMRLIIHTSWGWSMDKITRADITDKCPSLSRFHKWKFISCP